MAAAADEQALDSLLRQAGIRDYSPEALHASMEALRLSRSGEELLELFATRDYAACAERLAARGVETSPAEYDLINDVLRCAGDTVMGSEIDKVTEIDDAAKVLRDHGYYHITRDFLRVLVQYSLLLAQNGLINEEEGEKFDFRQRCLNNIGTLCAVGVIASLRYGVETPFSPAYLIAISGGAALAEQRFAA